MKSFPRYTWVGNRIAPEAMAEMYRIRRATGKPITQQVAEAVRNYLEELNRGAAATVPQHNNPQTRKVKEQLYGINTIGECQRGPEAA